MDQVSPPGQPRPEKSDNTLTNIILGLIILILIAGIAFVGFLALKSYRQTNKLRSTTDQAVVTPTPLSTNTSTWSTFSSNQFGISFKHPNLDDKCCTISGPGHGDFTTLTNLANPTTFVPDSLDPIDGLSVAVVPYPRPEPTFQHYIEAEKVRLLALKKIYKQDWTPQNYTQQPITIAGQEGIVLIDYSFDTIDRYYIPLPAQNYVLEISKSESQPGSFSSIFSQILGTLQLAQQ